MQKLVVSAQKRAREEKMSKYNSKKVIVDGITFDSKKESRRYTELKILEAAGEISDLTLQPEFVLLPPQYVDGKCAERAVKYKADFMYTENGKTVVEDTKGFKTKDYVIKRKLMLYIHGIRVREV